MRKYAHTLTLKTLVILATLAIFSLSFISCSSSDDESAAGDDDLPGNQTDGDQEPTDDIDGDEEAAEREYEAPTECTKKCWQGNRESIDFGSVAPGQVGEADFMIQSTGVEPIHIFGVELGRGANSPFQILSFDPGFDPDLGRDLNPRQVLTVRLLFVPLDLADANDYLLILTDADTPELKRTQIPIRMQWKGRTALKVTPAALQFENTNVTDQRAKLTYTIEAVPDELNTTTRPLWVKSIVTINDNSPFFLEFGDNCPDPDREGGYFVIDPSDTSDANLKRTCSVAFDPNEIGTFEDKIKIEAIGTDEGATQNAEITLSGEGVSPGFFAYPSEIDFGYYLTQDIAAEPKIVTLENNEGGQLIITSLEWTNANDAFRYNDPEGIIGNTERPITGDSPATIEFFYEPSAPSVGDVGNLRIHSNSVTKPYFDISLFGIAVDECPTGFYAEAGERECRVDCEPGDMICWPEEGADGYRDCPEEDTLGDFYRCPEVGDVCLDGFCTSQSCTPGETRCYSNQTQMQHCREDGLGWQEPVDCPSVSESCKVNECRSAEGDLECTLHIIDNGTLCDDNDECTLVDTCFGGECVGDPNMLRECDDENPCTEDGCDPVAGCVFNADALEGQRCDDENPCTLDERCGDGTCNPSRYYDCDDDNLCTDDICDPEVEGLCVHFENVARCDTGNMCSVNDHCVNGECTSGGELECMDEDPCTEDYCLPASGCHHEKRAGIDCDDGNPCTTNEKCQSDFAGNIECRANGELDCETGNPCTRDYCSESEGGCVHEIREGLSCSDDNRCTTGDRCNAEGICEGSFTGEYLCDDGNPCTDDYCNPDIGCINVANDEPCDDGNPCTLNDFCNDKSCQAGYNTLSCDDDNPCTLDQCNAGECVGEDCQPEDYCKNTPAFEDEFCEADENSCTIDRCSNGVCVAGISQYECPPDTACIHYECNGDTGECEPQTLSGEPCDDGNPCTNGDVCNENGVCTSGTEPLACDDGDPCKTWHCEEALGCYWTPNSGSCDDANACTSGETCVNGACTGGTPLSCDDDNPCTEDSCYALAAEGDDPCLHAPQAGIACSDDNPCTLNDICNDEGLCVSGNERDCDDDNICTADACDPESTLENPCTYLARVGQPCDDNDSCTENDACDIYGKCKGIVEGCDIEELCENGTICETQCASATCNAQGGCELELMSDGTSCNDGNPCTVEDECQEGFCVGAAKDCDDGNICTNDACDPQVAGGCVYEDVPFNHPSNVTACTSDNNVCTYDVCKDGLCRHLGGYFDDTACETDWNDCTEDVCSGGTCTHNALTGQSCNDNSVCTTNDQCNNEGVCTGNQINCEPQNECQISTGCSATDGCLFDYKPSGTSCTDDGNNCTYDYCQNGTCIHPNKPNGTDCGFMDRCRDGRCI